VDLSSGDRYDARSYCPILFHFDSLLRTTGHPGYAGGKCFRGLAFGTQFRQPRSARGVREHRYNIPGVQSFPVEATLNLRRMSGGFTLLRIEQSEPLSITALLAEKDSDRIARRMFTLSADDPRTVVGATLLAITRPTDLALPRLTEDAALNALAKRADTLAAEDRLSGAMLIARRGTIVFEKNWGLADREIKTPVTPQTRFRLGSANKMFTAIAVLQLVNEGKLALDGTVGRYLPDYPSAEVAGKVTVRHLLNHTGGTGDIFGPEFMARRTSLKTHADYVQLYGARAPEFEPGTKVAYSNYGMVLLGTLIEKVRGMSYYDYVRENIFRPAGMSDTDSLPEDQNVPNRSLGYMWQTDGWTSNADTLPYRGTAAGGGYSTVRDLLRFANALETGTLLPKALLEEATTPQNQEGWYGYGFMLGGEGALRSYGHGGGAPGMNADFRIYPELGVVVVGLSNLDVPAATRIVEFYTARMPVTR
jgi:CubicO group peptidase (beta-lactamase class C family)